MLETSCRWAKTQLPLWVGGELIGADRRRVDRHLLSCLHCRVRRDQLTQSLSALAVLVNKPLTDSSKLPSLWPAISQQIQESRHPLVSAAPWWRLLAWPMTGLSMATFLIIGLVLGRPLPVGEVAPDDSVTVGRPALPTSTARDDSSETLTSTKVELDSDSSVSLPISTTAREPQPSS